MSAPAPRELAMFPLGMVLFPSAILPLHVFEPRYRALVAHLVSGEVEPEVGVVLIERGSEVGGGDVRVDVGTLARIVRAEELPDGGWGLVSFGISRIEVLDWLPDDPWPRAMVVELVDQPGPGDPPDASVASPARWEALRASVRCVLAKAVELGDPTPPATIELAPEPALGTFQAAAIVGFGTYDQQRVLASRSVAERLDLLEVLTAERDELLEARLRLG